MKNDWQNDFDYWMELAQTHTDDSTEVQLGHLIREHDSVLRALALTEATYPDIRAANHQRINARGGNGAYDQFIMNPTRGGEITLANMDARAGYFQFSVPGDSWPNSKDFYNVEIKFDKDGRTDLGQLDVQVKCDCPFFVFNGPEYHAKQDAYLLGAPGGTASTPDIRDPERVYYACKHLVAVFSLMDKKFNLPPSWFVPQK